MIPLHEPTFAGNEWRYVKRCVDTTWVSSAGPFGRKFESMMAARLGVKHAIAVVNGTAGLHLALLAAGVKPGDEVLVPTLTFIATANAALYAGARLRLLEAEAGTLGVDADALESFLKRETERAGSGRRHKKSGRRIAACVPMHVFGHPCRIDAVVESCARRGIPVVEDAAEGLGSSWRGRALGTFGVSGVLSFNGNKILTTGGGGMIVTNDAKTAARARHLSTQAKKDAFAYVHDEAGYNYRLPDINAALGCAQLEQLDGFLRKKRAVAGWYREGLAGASGVELIWEPKGARSNFWLNTVRLPTEALAKKAMKKLIASGLESRPVWTPCHRQPYIRAATAGPLATADALARTCINLPSSPNLSRAQVARACEVLRS